MVLHPSVTCKRVRTNTIKIHNQTQHKNNFKSSCSTKMLTAHMYENPRGISLVSGVKKSSPENLPYTIMDREGARLTSGRGLSLAMVPQWRRPLLWHCPLYFARWCVCGGMGESREGPLASGQAPRGEGSPLNITGPVVSFIEG